MGMFYLEGVDDYLICYNCGLANSLHVDHTLRHGYISHSITCKFLPADAIRIDAIQVKENEAIDTNKGSSDTLLPEFELNGHEDSSNNSNSIKQTSKEIGHGSLVTVLPETDLKGKDMKYQDFNNDSDVLKETLQGKNTTNNKVTENSCKEILADDDNDHEVGMFSDCYVCKEDKGFKVINYPCSHLTYCAVCASKIKRCSYCKKNILCFFPLFLGYDTD